MRLHESTYSRRLYGITTLGLALAATGLLGSPPSQAAGVCGGSASDVFGTFTARRTPPPDAPDHGHDQPLTVTFSTPNKVQSDNKALNGGQVYATMKGSGTFSVQPLKWTEQGTMTIGDKSGPYESNFAASKIECTSGTQVSSFTGTFSSPSMVTTDTETYTRAS
jgi:hypothetical protein